MPAGCADHRMHDGVVALRRISLLRLPAFEAQARMIAEGRSFETHLTKPTVPWACLDTDSA